MTPKRRESRRLIYKKVNRAVNSKRLIKPNNCEKCQAYFEDNRLLHGHHSDYSQPLKVQWLCMNCHKETHRK